MHRLDGFQGAEEGLYYQEITADELPEFAFCNEEGEVEFSQA